MLTSHRFIRTSLELFIGIRPRGIDDLLGFNPGTCGARRMVETAAGLVEYVFPRVRECVMEA